MTQPLRKYGSSEPSLSDISKDCFTAMQSPASLALTVQYHVEEKAAIRKILAQSGIEHFIAIGSGDLRYIDVAFDFGKTYTAIEPSFKDELTTAEISNLKDRAGVSVIAKGLEDVTPEELPEGRRLFFFLFNVFPYIDDALALQRKLAKPGDIVVVSGWNNDSFEARRLQDIYYDHLGREFRCNLTEGATNGYLDGLQRDSAGFAETASRVKGRTTDILTLKVK